FFGLIFSQEISSVPEFPTDSDQIEIVFDATKSVGKGVSLNNYTGDLYAHTGVITSKSSGSWKNVIGNWGENNVQPKLFHIGSGLYKLVIGNPRVFYNGSGNSTLATDENILKMMFVFRTPNGSQQTEDLSIEIFETGIKIKLLVPTSFPIFPEISQTIKIKFVVNEADTVRLFVDDNFILESTNDTLETTIPTSEIGKKWIKLVATSDTLPTKIDSFYYFVRSPITITELPQGIETGINYIDNSTVTLAIYAPHKDFIYLTGDFNNWEFAPSDNPNWEFDEKYYMNLTPDSTTFWKTISNLNVEQEYRFQYLVDGTLQIADPYADKILEGEDNQIPSNIYPNLISYPSDKTNFSVSTFQTEQTPFNWEVTNFDRPKKENLVIYEMLVRDFVSTHSYQTIIDTLDYIDSLGITALELMPIMEFEFNNSWGYNTSFYFAPDKYYGTKNDLKQLIDECHKRGIAVIFDIVLNHMYGRSPFVRLYSSGDYGPPTSENPWFNVTSPNQVFSFGHDLNHESEQTRKLVDRVNKYWLEEYNIDGYRFDFTKGMTNTPGDGGSFDQARINILKRMANKIWEYDSTAYVILEHFAPDSEEKILANSGMMLWGNLNHNYNEATMGYNENFKSDFSRISYKKHGFTKPNVVGYMESHDEERLMYKNLTFGNSSGNYKIKDVSTALQRIKMAATFFFTVPGPKMIWQFGELGYDVSIDFNGRVGEKPIRWNYFTEVNRLNLYKTFKHLINLKNNYDVFNTNNFSIATGGSVKRIKLTHDSLNVVVVGNFNTVTSNISPSFHFLGKWYDYFSGDTIVVSNPAAMISLDAGEFHIYTSKKLPTPKEDIITNISNSSNSTDISEFQLYQNYPNPFNPTTTIRYNIPVVEANFASTTNVTLKVFDILGSEIKTLVNEIKQPGNYEIKFDASKLTSGVYFYRLQTGSFIETKKFLLLK
ncbi:MAG: alpha-amylase family glycosyl hydrolase, partial [Melioribacteraceae bacterium]